MPADLSERILEFFEYKLRSSKSGLQTTGIDELPAELAMLLTIQLHKDIIQKCPIFTNLPGQYLVSLLRKLRPVIFVPGHLVVKEGVVNTNLYFIHRGVVKVWRGYFGPEPQRQHLATLTNNDFFGETSLVQATAKQQTVHEDEGEEEDEDAATPPSFGPPSTFSAFTPKSTGTLMATLRAEVEEEEASERRTVAGSPRRSSARDERDDELPVTISSPRYSTIQSYGPEGGSRSSCLGESTVSTSADLSCPRPMAGCHPKLLRYGSSVTGTRSGRKSTRHGSLKQVLEAPAPERGGANATIECVSYCEMLTLSKSDVDQGVTSRKSGRLALKVALVDGMQHRNRNVGMRQRVEAQLGTHKIDANRRGSTLPFRRTTVSPGARRNTSLGRETDRRESAGWQNMRLAHRLCTAAMGRRSSGGSSVGVETDAVAPKS